MKISLRCRHALTVADGAFSHKIDYVTNLKEILNPEGHPNRITGSKVTAILLNGGFCPLVELHWEGSAPAACAAGLFLTIESTCQENKSTIKHIFRVPFKDHNHFDCGLLRLTTAAHNKKWLIKATKKNPRHTRYIAN